MSIHLLNNSRRYRLWFVLVLPIVAALSACSGGGSDDPEPTPTPGSLTMTIRAKAPQITGEIIANSSDGTEVNTSFIPEWETNSTVNVFARQSGRLYSFGQQSVALTASDHNIGNIQFDGTDKLDASKSYEVYGMACPLRQDGNSLYYVSDLHRGGSVDSYFKVASGKSTAEVTKTIAGAVETLYIINKTDHPIVFRHKGFDVEKPWYYTHAEVNVDNGSVVNGKQESDALSNYVVASSFNGSNAKAIHSFYVPNGTKIQDAQLIADISGQEVRSSNRISSDITLQNNHAYAIFAVWDGETLTLGDKVEEVEVFVCSGENNDSIIIQEVRDDGTVIMSGSLQSAPKPGEIIVSGISKAAPQGFLYKVKEIQGTDGSYQIKTEEATLDELLPDFSGEIPIPFGNAASARFRGADGRVRPANIRRISKEVDIIDIDWKGMVCAFPENPGVPTFSLLSEQESKNFDASRKSSVGINYNLSAKMSASLVLETHKEQNRRFGLKGELEFSATLGAIASLKDKFDFGKYKIGEIELSPIEVVIPVMGIPIPIVFTPKIYIYVQIEATGEVYISAQLLSYKAGGYFDYCYYYDGHPLTGEHNVFDADWSYGPIEDISDPAKAGASLIKGDNLKIGLKGELKGKFNIEPNIGLYNSNDRACIAVEVSPFVSLKGNTVYTFYYNSAEEHVDSEFSDEFSLNVGLDGKVSGRIKLWGDPKEFGKDFTIFSMPLWEPFGIAMRFENFNLEQKNDNEIYVTCKIIKPSFQVLEDVDYGFCYGTDANKKDKWTYISLKDKYDSMLDGFMQNVEMQYILNIESLKSQTQYFIRPYVKYFGTYFYKKGGSFQTITGDNGATIPIIPGEDL